MSDMPSEVAFSDVYAALDAERHAAAILFAEWAEREDILSRFTEAQHADIARAFIAGYLSALTGSAPIGRGKR